VVAVYVDEVSPPITTPSFFHTYVGDGSLVAAVKTWLPGTQKLTGPAGDSTAVGTGLTVTVTIFE
jgi:hypothetical protein